MWVEGQGARAVGISVTTGMVSGPTAIVAQLPVAIGTSVARSEALWAGRNCFHR